MKDSDKAKEEARRQIGDIGKRFLERTGGEIKALQQLLEGISSDAPGALKQIEMIAHRIHGTGAVFGFAAISNAAETVETLALQGLNQKQLDVARIAAQLTQAVAKLEKSFSSNSSSSPTQT